MAEYTKGEWKVLETGQTVYNGYVIQSAECEGVNLAYAEKWDIAPTEARANANLIASAPDMYEALEEIALVWAELDHDRRFPHLEEVITKALSKAREVI